MKEMLFLFLRMGLVAFGGPAAHIAMMQLEIVERRKWMTDAHFLDLVGATSLIPGPNSTEMTMHCGYHKYGWKGLVIAGAAFILPATLLTYLLAVLYEIYQSTPQIAGFLIGLKPIVIALIVKAVYKLSKRALKNTSLKFLAVLAAIAFFFLPTAAVILLSGLIYFLFNRFSSNNLRLSMPLLSITAVQPETAKIFFLFLKIGAILFGSGYVLIAYLENDLVNKLGWLSQEQLLDAIAIGQLTPGPVLSTATFVGYILSGWKGAVAATAGIFLPSFLFVGVLNPLIPKMRNSTVLSKILDGVNVGALGAMGAVALKFTYLSSSNWQSLLLTVLGFVLVFRFKKLAAHWVVIIGGLAGAILHLVFG